MSYRSVLQPRPLMAQLDATDGVAFSPPAAWQARAASFLDWAGRQLWRTTDAAAQQQLVTLQAWGLTLRSILEADLGYNPRALCDRPERWGLPSKDSICIPAGLVVPWFVDGVIGKMTIHQTSAHDEDAPIVPGGYAPFYRLDQLQHGQPALVLDNPLRALVLQQRIGASAVVIGIMGWGGDVRERWRECLHQAAPLIVAPPCDALAVWCQEQFGPHVEVVSPLPTDPAALPRWIADVGLSDRAISDQPMRHAV